MSSNTNLEVIMYDALDLDKITSGGNSKYHDIMFIITSANCYGHILYRDVKFGPTQFQVSILTVDMITIKTCCREPPACRVYSLVEKLQHAQ